MKTLESLLPGYVQAEPQSRYSPEVIIIFDKNANKQPLLKKFRKYNICVKELDDSRCLLSPSDGESNDLLRSYVGGYFKYKR
jgi:hypothetical protein